MTYKDFLDRVNDKVRHNDSWPDSATPTDEQVDLSFLAAVAVASEIPLSYFKPAAFSLVTLTTPQTAAGVDRYTLPAAMFAYRNDLGISTIHVGGSAVELDEAISLASLRRLAVNPFYADGDTPFISVNLSDRRVYVPAGVSVQVNHLTMFEKPALANISTADYPLEATHAERSAAIVATHVEGEKFRDTAAAQFQALLQRQYTQAPPPALQTSETEQ